MLIAADVLLALGTNGIALGCGIALWGLHLGITQGLLATMIADTAPPALRGTAYGLFNLASGIAMLLASAIAGLLWDQLGGGATFAAGAVFSASALAVLLLRRAPLQAATDSR